MRIEEATTEEVRTAVIAVIEERDRLAAENKELREVLDRLARLGNEPNYGNSIGNQIAIAALDKSKGE